MMTMTAGKLRRGILEDTPLHGSKGFFKGLQQGKNDMNITQADRDYIEELTTATDKNLEVFGDGFSFVRLADVEPEATAAELCKGWESNTKARSYYRRYNEANHAEQEQHGLTSIERTARTDANFNTRRSAILADVSVLVGLTDKQQMRAGLYYGIGQPRYTVRQIAKMQGVGVARVHNSIRKARKAIDSAVIGV